MQQRPTLNISRISATLPEIIHNESMCVCMHDEHSLCVLWQTETQIDDR